MIAFFLDEVNIYTTKFKRNKMLYIEGYTILLYNQFTLSFPHKKGGLGTPRVLMIYSNLEHLQQCFKSVLYFKI